MCVFFGGFFSIDPALHQITITNALVYLDRLLLSPHIMHIFLWSFFNNTNNC